MSRQPQCGLLEARNRAKVARSYLDVAELAAHEPADGTRNVAAGNAVLAGIAASDLPTENERAWPRILLDQLGCCPSVSLTSAITTTAVAARSRIIPRAPVAGHGRGGRRVRRAPVARVREGA